MRTEVGKMLLKIRLESSRKEEMKRNEGRKKRKEGRQMREWEEERRVKKGRIHMKEENVERRTITEV